MQIASENPAHAHGLNTVTGYIVVRTDWSDGAANLWREDVERFEGATSYVHALESVRNVRASADPSQYGVIDWLYACGCRSV